MGVSAIGVILILGTTYTCEFEPIRQVQDRVVAYNTTQGTDTPTQSMSPAAVSPRPSCIRS